MKKLRRKKGLTLVELILAMAIFSILVVAFMTVFTSSMTWVFNAGNKGIAYNLAQEEIEIEMAKDEGFFTDDLEISFPDADYTIRSWRIDSDQSVGIVDSKISAYVPQLPAISINPTVLTEGATIQSIEITGYGTHFNASTSFELYDMNGFSKISGSHVSVINESQAIASAFVTSNPNLNHLTLVNDNYIVRVTTRLDDGTDEIARAKLTINQPNFILAGDSKLYISADGENWITRSKLANIPEENNMVALASSGSQYVLVSSDGKALYSQEKNAWELTSVGHSLTDVVWSITLQRFYALADNGLFYNITNSQSWHSTSLPAIPEAPEEPEEPEGEGLFRGFEITQLSDTSVIYTVVGDRGAIYSSSNASSWTRHTNELLNAINWYSTVSGYLDPINPYLVLVAVGENGSVTYSYDGYDWKNPSQVAPDRNINAVSFGQEKFIAVGDGGLIMTSENGISWTERVSGTSENLNSVHVTPFQFIVAGDNGTLLRSTNGSTWLQPVTLDYQAWSPPSQNFNAIGGR